MKFDRKNYNKSPSKAKKRRYDEEFIGYTIQTLEEYRPTIMDKVDIDEAFESLGFSMHRGGVDD